MHRTLSSSVAPAGTSVEATSDACNYSQSISPYAKSTESPLESVTLSRRERSSSLNTISRGIAAIVSPKSKRKHKGRHPDKVVVVTSRPKSFSFAASEGQEAIKSAPMQVIGAPRRVSTDEGIVIPGLNRLSLNDSDSEDWGEMNDLEAEISAVRFQTLSREDQTQWLQRERSDALNGRPNAPVLRFTPPNFTPPPSTEQRRPDELARPKPRVIENTNAGTAAPEIFPSPPIFPSSSSMLTRALDAQRTLSPIASVPNLPAVESRGPDQSKAKNNIGQRTAFSQSLDTLPGLPRPPNAPVRLRPTPMSHSMPEIGGASSAFLQYARRQ